MYMCIPIDEYVVVRMMLLYSNKVSCNTGRKNNLTKKSHKQKGEPLWCMYCSMYGTQSLHYNAAVLEPVVRPEETQKQATPNPGITYYRINRGVTDIHRSNACFEAYIVREE